MQVNLKPNEAWVDIQLPTTPDKAFALALDLETLFRFNPYLEVRNWQARTPLAAGSRIRLDFINEINGLDRTTELTVEAITPGQSLRLSWAEGLKIATEIRISPHAGGTTLTIKDIYQLPEGEPDEETLREVDKSLTPWGIAIRRHVLNRARWGGLPFYGKIMRWFYAMPPRHRRISRLIAWSTLIEFVVFLLVFAVFQVETGG